MTHTHFANPSGLDEAGHHSCALDMARLMACAMREPAFAQIVSAKIATAGTRTMSNHNKLLGAVEGCVGGKTGYTGAAGRTLVTCAERDGLRLIAVTLRDGNDWADHAALYDYGFASYRAERPIRRGEICATAAVRGGKASFAALCAETLSAPVFMGQAVGEAVVLLDGAEVARVALQASRTVEAAEYRQPRFWRR
jgi:D-alanyl-D-alanine carboxypeptidase